MRSDPVRRRGRPPLVAGEKSTSVHVKVPSKDYDRAYRQSQRDRVSVPDVFRRGLVRVLADGDDDED